MTRAAIIIAAAVTLIAALLFGVTQCQERQTATTRAKIATGQAGAALESGSDAAGTIGNRMESDAQTDSTTRTNADAIRNAEGAAAPVAAPVRDAGLLSLCRRVAYRNDPRCVQHPGP